MNTGTAVYAILSSTCLILVWWSPGMHNVLNLLTPPMYPFFIVAVRFLFALSASNILAIIWMANKSIPLRKPNSSLRDEKSTCVSSKNSSSHQIATRSMSATVFNVISRLSFSLHMVNYIVIKYEFASSRTLLNLYPFRTIERILSYFTLMVPAALIFEVFFTSPLNQVRKFVISCLTRAHDLSPLIN